MSDMVTVGSYLDPMEVQFARLHLEEHGIRVAVVETSNFDPTLIGVSGGIRLQVAEKDELQARTLLRALASERTEVDPDAVAIDLIRTLSQQDFPGTAPEIGRDGSIGGR